MQAESGKAGKAGKTRKSAETPKPLRKDYKCNQVKRRKQTIKIVLSAKAEKASSSSIKRRATEEKGFLSHFPTALNITLLLPRFSTSHVPPVHFFLLPGEIKTQRQVKFIKY